MSVTKWEYRLVSLGAFDTPSADPATSAAVTMLNEEGGEGWEAVGLTNLDRGGCAVLMKRVAVFKGRQGGERI